MAGPESADTPDLAAGLPLDAIADGAIVHGRVGDDDVLLARRGDEVFAFGAYCTHYHGPLAEGLLVGDTVRCPWHHACFALRSGEALRAPALDSIACWRVERSGGKVFVREKLAAPARTTAAARAQAFPKTVVIIGGGAAGLAAAEMLRREGYDGALTMLSADDSPPCDRPNLSKDYLAGTAPEDWIPLRPPEFYTERKIDLRLGTRVATIDVGRKQVGVDGGASVAYDALLIATGADPVRLDIQGAGGNALHYLRSFSDSRALIARAQSAKRVAVIGASFIGLEVAASLRARGIDVHVIAPESAPLERVMGAEVGAFVRDVHVAHGVVFHLGRTVSRIDGSRLTLSDASDLDVDFVVAGVGVRPSLALAQTAGIALDRGIRVDAYLETSARGVYAAGDVARWPDPHSGDAIRVEHWVVAERMGQTAARNILGAGERFDAVPFFWSQHYDRVIHYVGHAEKWDAIAIDGSLADGDAKVSYQRAGRTLAVATIGRDLESLRAEREMEAA
jgi:apoptosis-inducing factor 3